MLDIEILADGTIKTTTDPVSAANHASADEFLSELTKLTGGERSVSRRKGRGPVHTHGGVTHRH